MTKCDTAIRELLETLQEQEKTLKSSFDCAVFYDDTLEKLKYLVLSMMYFKLINKTTYKAYCEFMESLEQVHLF